MKLQTELSCIIYAAQSKIAGSRMVSLKKIAPIELRAIGLDERWLQARIQEDTSILGLGELEIMSRELRQPHAGRIDFLMHQAETETFYEVEVMLGALDESHIIRTIEYWDIERQRRPQFDHRAVIVAEQITARFFNVLRLLNRAVPLIAVQLGAFQVDEGSIVLHAVKVLDVVEEIAVPDVSEQVEQTDRAYWEKRRDPSSLAVMDRIVDALKEKGVQPRLTYNKGHVALGSTGNNFAWFHPRKSAGYCHVEMRLSPDDRDDAISTLQNSGMDPFPKRTDSITFSETVRTLDEHMPAILGVLEACEKYSR